MRTVACCAVLLGLAASVFTPSPLRAETACPDDQNFFAPFRCAEESAIAASDGSVTRRRGELVLTTEAGPVTFSDRDQCGDDGRPFAGDNCVSYIFVRRSSKNHGFVVLVGYYEGYAYRWIDDVTGRVTALDNDPHFSPDGDFFVVVNATESYGRNGVWVWASRGPRLLWSFEPQAWALFAFIGWDGDNAIHLNVQTRPQQGEFVDNPARIVRTEFGWKRKGPPAE